MTQKNDPRDRPNAEQVREMAEAKFKQQQDRLSEGVRATADYHAEGEATRKKTDRLKAQRLAKEAADTIARGIAKASPGLKVKKTGKSQIVS